MATLIKYELKKILGNRAGMVACALAFAMLLALTVGNLSTGAWRDYDTGEYVQGIAAQQVLRDRANRHAGLLTDERVAADAATLDKANELAKTTEGFWEDMETDQIIEKYGLEFWQQTKAVMVENYYMEVVGTLDSTNPRATSLKEGSEARLDGALEHDSANFSDAEKAYWKDKWAHISWPVEYGDALGWENVIEWASFYGLAIVALCIALSGVFAGEYQSRAAAVVLPTRRGKRALPAAKVAASLIFATVYWLFCAGVPLCIILGICGTDGWNLPLQVVTGFDNPYPLTIGQTVVLVHALEYLITIGMVAFTLALSAKLRQSMPVAVIPLAITFLGVLALFIGVNWIAKLGLLTPFSGSNFAFGRMVSYAAGSFVVDLPTMLAMVYGVAFVFCVPLAAFTWRRHQVA